MKEFFTNTALKTIAVVTFVAVVLIVLTYNYLIEFSSFAVGILKGVLGFSMVWALDKYAMKELDTIEELKKGNIAYALFILGLFIVIAAAIIYS